MSFSPTEHTDTRRYANATLQMGPMTRAAESASINFKASEVTVNNLVSKYPMFFSRIEVETPQQIQNRVRVFDHAHIENASIFVGPVKLQDNHLISIVVFINGKLLDFKKLPQPPLKIVGDTINGRSLDEFIIPSEQTTEIHN